MAQDIHHCCRCQKALHASEVYAGDDWEPCCAACAPAGSCPECRGWGCRRRCRPPGDRRRKQLEECPACGGGD